MDILQERAHLCVVCKSGHIIEQRTEHTREGDDIPDQSNCDFSTYDGYKVVSGKLLKNCSNGQWVSASIRLSAADKNAPALLGGICEGCLGKDEVQALLPYLAVAPWT